MPLSTQTSVPIPSGKQPLVLEQKRFSTRTRFELGDEDFAYRLETGGSSRSCRIEYVELSADRETVIERDKWWRNVGILWVLIAVVSIALQSSGGQPVHIPIWLWLGLIAYVVYRFRVVRYQIIPSGRGNVVIIDDCSGARIIDLLLARRAKQLRKRYDYITFDEHPEQQRHRFQWLRQQGVLDDHEVSARLLQLDAILGAQRLRHDEHDED